MTKKEPLTPSKEKVTFKELVEKYLESTKAGDTQWSKVVKEGKDVGDLYLREGIMAPSKAEGYFVELYKHKVDDSFMWLLSHESQPPIYTWIPRQEDEEFYNVVEDIWMLKPL